MPDPLTTSDDVGTASAERNVLMRAESSAAARTGAFIAVTVALFCIQLDFFAPNLAIPGISHEFGVTAPAVQWTLSAYLLAIGCSFIVGGRLGDVFGRRGTLLTGITLSAAGSVGCALAPGKVPPLSLRAAPLPVPSGDRAADAGSGDRRTGEDRQ
ncbi:MFS transporter [Streptomyces sp. NPDC001970]